MAACQPMPSISPWPTGAITIVPSDPAAATMPTVLVRFAGGVERDTVPMSTPNPVPAVPTPARNPAIASPPGIALANAMSSKPAAYVSAVAISTGLGP